MTLDDVVRQLKGRRSQDERPTTLLATADWLRDHGWDDLDGGPRTQAAPRLLFQRWRIEQGRLTDE